MRRAAGDGADGPAVSPSAFVRRLGEAGCLPGDGWVGTLDLLARSGLPVPEGFVLTAEAHREFLRTSGLEAEILSRARDPETAMRGQDARGLGEALEREIRVALLDLGAPAVVVGSGRVLRRGLGTIPAVVSAVREAWSSAGALERQVSAARKGRGIPTWPVLVQRQARPEYTGWTTTAGLQAPPRHGRPKNVPLHDVEPAARRGREDISRLTRRAAGMLEGPLRLGWGLEDGRWLLVSVGRGPRERQDHEDRRRAMFPTKILLATDGSEESAHAARMSAALSEKTGSELHVVYVEPLPQPYALSEATIYYPEMRDEVREMAERDAHEKLAAEVEKIEAMGGVAGSHARIGQPDAEISHLAEEIGAGLIVLGSRGLGPFRRLLMGSVSSSVVRHAHGPVLVVREGGDALPERILLAADGSEESRLAVQAAAELSAKTGAEVHIAHVLPSPERMYGPHFYSADMRGSLLERVEREAREFLDRQTKIVASAGGRVGGTHVASGNAPAEVVKLAEELHAGLTVLGSRGLGGVRRALMGSVSDSVVCHAHNPVLVVREDRGRDG